MTSTTKAILKSYFNTGDKPTELQFAQLIDSFLPSFRPEDFGAVGDGITNDTAAIQAAIDAASNEGGGIIHLNGNYAYDIGGVVDLAVYPNVHYAVLINHENIYIKGPGTLRMTHIPDINPSSESFTCVLFTKLVHSEEYPVLGEPWLDSVGIEKVVFDNTALTQAQLSAFTYHQSGEILFSHVKHFYCRDNFIKKGWG